MSHTHQSESEEISSHTSCWTMTKRTFCLLVILGFCAMRQKADAQITLGKPVLSGPSISAVNEIEEFFCKLDNIQTNETILYELFKEGHLNKVLGVHSSHSKEEARFIALINFAYDGRLICKASVQNNTEIIPTYSDWKVFKVLEPVKGAQIISIPSLEDLWEGDSLTLQCNITEGTYVLYDWHLNDELLHNDSSIKQITIPSLSSHHSGKYVCHAKNYFNETEYYISKTEERNVHVKEYLSKPEISFDVVKDAEGNFNARVKCQVTNGSTPINFTLFRNNQKFATVISEHQNTSFVVPIVLDQDTGTAYCHANNGRTAVQSRELNLTVESVRGPVTMKLKETVGKDFDVQGVSLYCRVERGTFPKYHWFLNNRKLDNQGSFYKTFHQDHSDLVILLHPHNASASAGNYYCVAVNSFDNTTSVSSQHTLISHEALNKIPTEVAVTVFTLFSLLICAVLACCIYGVVLRKRQARKYMFRLKDFTEKYSLVDDDGVDDKTEEIEEEEYKEGEHDGLDTEAYTEDMEVVQASMMEDSDESEEEEETHSDNSSF